MSQITAVQPAPAQAPKAADKTHGTSAEHTSAEGAGNESGATSARSAFHHMLQGVAAQAQLPSDAADAAVLGGQTDGALLAELPVMLSIDALVGQTARLDAQADLATRNGTLDASAGAGSWLGAGQGAALSALSLGSGAGVQTVAAGVAPAGGPALNTAVALSAAQAQLQQAVGDAAAALDGTAQSVGDAPLEQGRMVLSGEWQLANDATPTPAMQRVMGQVEQWAAAAAGLQPKGRAQEGGTPGVAAGTEASALTSASSSGTRLTEQAVREAVQTEPSGAAAEGPEQPPVEDMRFWLQGRQQRAQVVLNHGDQQVRVQVAVQGQQAQVIFSSDEQATRAQLDAQMSELREQLQQQGLELVGVRVQADGGEGAQGQSQSPAGGDAAAPWQVGGAARTAQVAVPVAAEARAAASRAAGGLDLYV